MRKILHKNDLLMLMFVVSIVLLSSCATMLSTAIRYVVEVDAYGNDAYLASKKYLLVSGDSTVSENSLQYLEFSDLVKRALNAKGYFEAIDYWDDADLIVFFRYGISDPQTFEATRSVPVWGQTGVSSTITSGNVSVDPYSNNINYNQTTTSTPTYGVTGYRTQTNTYTKYFRYLTLSVYDLNIYKKTGKEKIVWNTVLTSDGSSDDLRKVIPHMIAVGAPYFGKSSGEKKSLNIYENDSRVKQLKGIE